MNASNLERQDTPNSRATRELKIVSLLLMLGCCVYKCFTFTNIPVSCERVQLLDHKMHLRAWSQAAPLPEVFFRFGRRGAACRARRRTCPNYAFRTTFFEMCVHVSLMLGEAFPPEGAFYSQEAAPLQNLFSDVGALLAAPCPCLCSLEVQS